MSKPSDDGFDLENYDYTDYASAHLKMSPLRARIARWNMPKICRRRGVATIKKVPQTPIQNVLNNKNKYIYIYICIIYCNTEKLGKQNQIKVHKLLSNLVGTVKVLTVPEQVI